MARISRKTQDKLSLLKEYVNASHEYFSDNYKRFHDFTRFICITTLGEQEKNNLQFLGKPALEFPVIEAYVSRLKGEFSQMEPGFAVRASELSKPNPKLIYVVEGHLKSIFISRGKGATLAYKLYNDLLVGGFSVAEIYTDYIHEMSMDQGIFVNRVFDPTLCGFDPLAREPHKGDGRYCFQLFPRTAEELEEEYGSDSIKDLRFTRSSDEFNWSYSNQKEDIAMVCDMYIKENTEGKIVKLSNGRVMPEKEYESFVEKWNNAGILEQPPVVVSSRKTKFPKIVRYRISGSKILEPEKKLDYLYLPLVFFDGNSVMTRDENSNGAKQFTRPYPYHAKDAQRLKNFSGQTLAAELENITQQKWISSLESIPKDYADAYMEPQKQQVLIYNAFKDGDPNVPLPPPQQATRTPIPNEIAGSFVGADSLIQVILGSYDASLGINKNEISGKAISAGAMQSNMAAEPYTNGFIVGWNRLAKIALDLIPKYYVTPRSIPIIKPDGSREYVMINTKDGVSLDYGSHDLEVDVEAGVNFAVQKQYALEMFIKLMNASPTFAAFVNQKGLPMLLDNLDMRGIDALKEEVQQWLKQQEKSQKDMQDKAEQQNPVVSKERIEMAKLQQKAQVDSMKYEQAQTELEIKAAEMASDEAIKNKEIDLEAAKTMSDVKTQQYKAALEGQKIDAENARSSVNLAIDVAKHLEE